MTTPTATDDAPDLQAEAALWLEGSFHRDTPEAAGQSLAIAQVYATLAVAEAVTRLADSYNGWKDLGR